MQINKINNLLELFYKQYQSKNKESIFLQSLKEPKIEYSWEAVYLNINKLSEEISKYIKKGDRCLLVSENRPEWMISDLAIMLSGGVTVPAYTTYTERDYEYIINDCTPTVIIISDEIQYKKIKSIISKNDFIKKIIFFENKENINEKLNLRIQDIFKRSNSKNQNFSDLKIQRTDMACIIYTSGTQGNPKGVMLSHGGILNNCEGANQLLKTFISKNPKFLTWLPLSHSYEHTVQFVQIVVGARVFYAESIDKLIKNMNECSPEIMTAVPRFYQNLHQKINASFSKVKGLKKILINQTVQLGKKKLNKKKFSLIEKLINFICEKLVRKKIKNQFGGNLKAFISGGGALDKEVGFFLNAIGLPTLQGYGLTETSPVVSCNSIENIRVETVGKPFEGNLVKIADDGEIIVKGENVMLGYWKNSEETEKVLKNGWLYTGDIGEFDGEFLKITDRKKDIIITPGGDNISPIKIENDLNKSDFIEQSVVYGDNKPYLVCLIVLSREHKHITEEQIQQEIDKINRNLSKIEKIKKFFIVKDQFTIENNMMTPTLKLKRFKIIKNYKKDFEKCF
ncbi:long-chain fatty acid--CoA ligase [Candidatus Pelagibacter sp. Uisw_099_02]|uniref:AMP-dependent synthetase/ligase n=1 Tax=Candidatus Pelagibacter sp. Uisw_099_02 TaxID=3230981 RepID=UPI00236D7B6F|nr:long-chain fatty acid--CoA ligase [Candidatus Pelagibacter sp.]